MAANDEWASAAPAVSSASRAPAAMFCSHALILATTCCSSAGVRTGRRPIGTSPTRSPSASTSVSSVGEKVMYCTYGR